jgi:hypothetical protein
MNWNSLAKTLLFAFLLTFASRNARAQITYFHYFNNGYEWYEGSWGVNFSHPNCTNGGDIFEKYYYHFTGQDSFDGHWWYRVHWDKVSRLECLMGPTIYEPAFPGPSVGFYLREDASRKIYVANAQMQTTLLYDFGAPLGIGDTLWMQNHSNFCKVGSIDSVYFGTELRRRFHCDCDNQPPGVDPKFVIEGVGANEGFQNTWTLCMQIADAESYTICAFKDGHELLVSNQDTCGIPGHILVGMEAQIAEDFPIRWNGARSEIWLDPHYLGYQWEILDMMGRRLGAGDLQSDVLDASRLPGGNYLLRLHDAFDSARVFRFQKQL